MAKLDVEISLLLAKKAHNDQLPPAERRQLEDPVNIRVTYQCELAVLEQLGLQANAVYGTFTAGRISLEGLELLARHPDVLAIERMRRQRLTLKNTVPRIKADVVRSRSGSVFNGITGKGVVIGIIDTGIDFRHPAFIKADNNTTRIWKLWDQTLQPEKGTQETSPPAVNDPVLSPDNKVPLGYGVEYTSEQINDNIQHSTPNGLKMRHVDVDGHGTKVAGIAAGDGSRAGNCESAFTYVGVAPEADLIVVRVWGPSRGDSPDNPSTSESGDVTLDAIHYILREVQAMKKEGSEMPPPVVINASLGTLTSFLDGSSASSKEIDRLLTAVPNFALVCAAGNEADCNFHVQDSVPAGPGNTLALKFLLQHDDIGRRRVLAVIYNGSNLRARVKSPKGTTNWVEPMSKSTDTTVNGSGGEVTIFNGENLIGIEITPHPESSNISYDFWTLELEDTAGVATPIDALCLLGQSTDPKSVRFHKDMNLTTKGTLTEIAATHNAITVGNYNMARKALDPSSARGMTLAQQKPEIVAPGDTTFSAASDDAIAAPGKEAEGGYRGCCCDCCEDAYSGLNGTSAATPHVTGVVALIMQQNPTWNYAQIKEKLLATAEPKPADLSPEDALGWGVGMVNAKAATSNGGGGGGGGMMAPSPEDTPLNQRLRSSGRSHELTQLFRKYFFEIRALINSNKKVATVWHRNKGPAWIRAAFRAIDSPALPFPFEVEGRSLTESIQHMLAILKRYGSPMLVQDMEKYAPEFQALREGMNLFELIDAVDPLPQP